MALNGVTTIKFYLGGLCFFLCVEKIAYFGDKKSNIG